MGLDQFRRHGQGIVVIGQGRGGELCTGIEYYLRGVSMAIRVFVGAKQDSPALPLSASPPKAGEADETLASPLLESGISGQGKLLKTMPAE
jgi:hypothetical protein